MQDANHFGLDPTVGGISITDARAWAENLVFAGFSEWRLPKMLDPGPVDFLSFLDGCLGSDCTDSEFGSLYSLTLNGESGNPPDYSQTPFLNVITTRYYWMDTFSAGGGNSHWYFFMRFGVQNEDVSSLGVAWAVHDGDIGVVPVPAAIWLFGTALVGLVGFGNRRKGNRS